MQSATQPSEIQDRSLQATQDILNMLQGTDYSQNERYNALSFAAQLVGVNLTRLPPKISNQDAP
ncbi:MAG: hypothetical protein IPL32_13715 [Chloracidobacterium sp.]|nr:hypothetical protein [Chloracidobacterium sp.]